MKNILVLLDLSSNSEHLINSALTLAKQNNAELLLCDALSAPLNKAIIFDDLDGSWPFEDKYHLSAQELCEQFAREIHVKVNCLDQADFHLDSLEKLVIKQNIWMIIAPVTDMRELTISSPENIVTRIVDEASCPVLLIPEHTEVIAFEKIAYLTDLRYCDIDVVNFLKSFRSLIFITHVSASGIPDMDDSYAQRLVSDEIAAKVNYNKLFLRNIKGKNRKPDLEKMVETAGVQLVAMVNKKHQLLNLFLQSSIEKSRNYHQLPLLILPYLNWHKV